MMSDKQMPTHNETRMEKNAFYGEFMWGVSFGVWKWLNMAPSEIKYILIIPIQQEKCLQTNFSFQNII